MTAAKAGLATWIGYDLLKLAQFMLAGFGKEVELILIAALGTMMVNVVRRPPALASRVDAISLAACAVSLGAIDVALAFGELPYRPTAAGETIALAAALLLLFGVVALGTSFTVLPAAIGVRTGGPFAFVRHPIYAACMLSNLSLAIGYGQASISVACALEAAALIWRAHIEERLLGDALPAYAAYSARIRFRFLPGIY